MAGDGIEDAERYTDTTAQRCPGRPQSGHEDDSLFGDGALLAKQAITSYSPLFHMAPPTMVIPRAGSLALAANLDLMQVKRMTP